MTQTAEYRNYLLHIFALSGFALAQPVMALLGNNPDFFVARGSQASDLFVLAAVLVFGLTLLAAPAYAMLATFSRRGLQVVHHAMVAILVMLIFLPVFKKYGLSDAAINLSAAGVGVVSALAYHRFRGLRVFVSALSPISFIFAAFFLSGTAAKELNEPAEPVRPTATALASSDTPLVVIIFDEFALTSLMDAEHNIDKSLFPNFQRLAENASWYRNATTVASGTMISVPAILTGNYPQAFVPQSFQNYPDTLFTLLADSHRMNVYESTTTLCAPELCPTSIKLTRSGTSRIKFLLADVSAIYLQIIASDSISTRLPAINMTWDNYWGLPEEENWEKHNYGGRLEQLEFFVNSIRKTDKPTLNLIHINFPHIPYQYLPSGNRYQGEWKIPGLNYITNSWGDNPWLVTQAYQRFLLQVGAADLFIGEVLDRLEAEELYDDSMIIVLADHGVSFYPDSRRRGVPPMINLDRDILPVPLFIKYPHQRGGEISDENVETMDILPTILDALGAETNVEMDGRSLLGDAPPRPGKRARYAYSKFLEYTFDAGGEEKYQTLDWKLKTFKSGDGVDGLYKIGKHSEIIGSKPSEHVNGEADDMRVHVDMPELYAAVDLHSGFIPSQVSGRIDTARPDLQADLAIAVNGTIRAVTQTYVTADNDYRFTAMVPEQSFRNGANSISVFQLESDDRGNIKILAIDSSYGQASDDSEQETWALVDGAVFRDGKELPFDTENVKGYLEFARKDAGTVEFFGWAVDAGNKETVEKVLIFEDGRYVFSGTTSMPREEGLVYDSLDALLLGFQFIVPTNLFTAVGESDIRLFVVSRDGHVAETWYFDAYTLGK